MTTEKFMFPCDVCGVSRQMGPHRYEMRKNQTYGIMVCDSCHKSNWDGWAPHLEERVTKNLVQNGTPLPARNGKGWLPRE